MIAPLAAVPAIVSGDATTWLAVAALGAVLALDDTSLGQTWLSLPVPAGFLAGLLVGRPDVGLVVGMLFQLATIGNLPVGMNFTLDPVSAVVGVTAGTVLGGWSPPMALDLGAASHWGWLLVATCLASLAGHAALEAERGLHLRWMLAGYRTLRDGNLGRLGRLQIGCLLVTAGRGALLTALFALLLQIGWLPAFELLPVSVERALALLALIVPGLAVGTLVERFGRRGAGPVVAAWSVACFIVAKYLF